MTNFALDTLDSYSIDEGDWKRACRAWIAHFDGTDGIDE